MNGGSDPQDAACAVDGLGEARAPSARRRGDGGGDCHEEDHTVGLQTNKNNIKHTKTISSAF